jgi:drug/metabolite transporter (DMT)-like permease
VCGFLALCLLSASAWLVDGAWPSLLPAAQRQALHNFLIALVVGAAGWKGIEWETLRVRRWVKFGAASVCLLGLPATLMEATGGGVPEVTAAALFALLPIVVVVLASNFDFGRAASAGTVRLLAPALIGLAGTLLLLSFALPDSGRQAWLYAMVMLAVMVAAFASVWMYRLLAEFSVVEAVVASCLANAAFFGVTSLVSVAGRGADLAPPWSGSAVTAEAATAILFDLPQMVLLLWLMRGVAPERLAARTLVVPLLTVLEGYALLRPVVTAQISLRGCVGDRRGMVADDGEPSGGGTHSGAARLICVCGWPPWHYTGKQWQLRCTSWSKVRIRASTSSSTAGHWRGTRTRWSGSRFGLASSR